MAKFLSYLSKLSPGYYNIGVYSILVSKEGKFSFLTSAEKSPLKEYYKYDRKENEADILAIPITEGHPELLPCYVKGYRGSKKELKDDKYGYSRLLRYFNMHFKKKVLNRFNLLMLGWAAETDNLKFLKYLLDKEGLKESLDYDGKISILSESIFYHNSVIFEYLLNMDGGEDGIFSPQEVKNIPLDLIEDSDNVDDSFIKGFEYIFDNVDIRDIKAEAVSVIFVNDRFNFLDLILNRIFRKTRDRSKADVLLRFIEEDPEFQRWKWEFSHVMYLYTLGATADKIAKMMAQDDNAAMTKLAIFLGAETFDFMVNVKNKSVLRLLSNDDETMKQIAQQYYRTLKIKEELKRL